MENNEISGGTAKWSRGGGVSPAGDSIVHPVSTLNETNSKTYLPPCQNDLDEDHNLSEICFGCGGMF